MKQRLLVAACALLVAAGASTFLGPEAASWKPMRMSASYMIDDDGLGFPDWIAERLMKQLDLSKPQKERMRAILAEYNPRLEELRRAARDDAFEMMEIPPSDPSYERTVGEFRTATLERVGEGIDLVGRMRVEIYSVLTPDQRAEAAELKTEMREWVESTWDRFGL